MNAAANEPGRLTISHEGQSVDLVLDGANTFLLVSLDHTDWSIIAPIALACMPDEVRTELECLQEGEDVAFDDPDKEILSLFHLAAVLEEGSTLAPVAVVAAAWATIPNSQRAAWHCHEMSSDDPIHAQILGRVRAGAVLFERTVPPWLPGLVKASSIRAVGRGGELFWTFAGTPLGLSCIAWVDDYRSDLVACLGISACNVWFQRAADPGVKLAIAAIDLLVVAQRRLQDDRRFAEKIGWTVTGHEAIDIAATLNAWRQRLQAAAELD